MDSASRTSSLVTGENCWRIEVADRVALIIDAADYFRVARKAMMAAERQILLIGWDFDTRIDLVKDAGGDGAPTTLGPFISWLAKKKPGLQIHILKWDTGALKLLGRGSTILRLLRWKLKKRIHFRLDSAHPTGASHHQKIVVIDDSVAFCGGIDMTGSRWDTRDHADDDQRRKRPFTKRCYGPWHDASMAVDGAAAGAIGDLARARWSAATGEQLANPSSREDVWPDELAPLLLSVPVAIARTRGNKKRSEEIREVETSFVDLIRSARHFVYAETQFFASRIIAEEIAKRLKEEDGPEFVIVNPVSAELWPEEEVMGPARAELLRAMADNNRHPRFRLYTPVTAGGADIYVHAKIMIVDDMVLRVGSANMNNRSMGLDTECDLIIDSRLDGKAETTRAISGVRIGLLAEHLGVDPAEVERSIEAEGSLIGAIERLRGEGRSLRPFEPPEWNGLEKKIARSEALDPEHADELFGSGTENRDSVAEVEDASR